jgi:SDR family mycofactocin-dependent oxidoreductase
VSDHRPAGGDRASVDADRTGRVAGQVALVTGAARGMGRSHCVRLAEEGADIVAVDVCTDNPSAGYPMGTLDELEETGRLVEATGRRVVTAVADVRDHAGLTAVVDGAVAELGRLDTVVANAGICTIQPWDEVTPQVWDDVLGVNLTGVWNTCVAAAPHLIAAGGGSMVLISSSAGLKGQPFFGPYSVSKHGVVGVMRVLANELADHRIRVNSLHPTGVATPMVAGLGALSALLEDRPNLGPLFMNSLPVDVLQPGDVSDVVLFLASDEARFTTGLTMTVDAGASAR